MDDIQEKGMLRLLKIIVFGVLITSVLSAHVDAKTVYVDTPGLCYEIEKVDGSQAFLRSRKQNCKKAAGKVPVEIDDDINKISIFKDGAFWKEQEVESDLTISHVTDFLKKGQELSVTMQLPESVYKEKGQKKAEELAEFYNSEKFQCTVNDAIKGLKQGVFKDRIEDYYEGLNKDKKKNNEGDNEETYSSLSQSERIYIFISSSVPGNTLKNYAADFDKVSSNNISMILRGFVGGMKHFKPTLDFVTNIIKKDSHCDGADTCETYKVNIQVDPLLFRRYGIKQVPAIVYLPDIKINDSSMSEGLEDNAQVKDYYVVYGDTSLEYALELIYRETKSTSLKGLIATLKKGFY